jgi:hypothetical protein
VRPGARDYVGVLVPGGAKSPVLLAESDEVLSFLQRVNSGGRLVASILISSRHPGDIAHFSSAIRDRFARHIT